MKRILVTGAAGFIGSHVAQRLVVDGHAVFGLIHDQMPPEDATGWNPVNGDVGDYPRLLELIVNCEIDEIYHFAARSIVRNCRLDPLGCFTANVLGTVAVLEAARQAEHVKGILVMESDKAYGPGPTPYREDQALVPEGIYEASKACVSHLVRAYHKNYNLPVFGVRSANVYGPGDPNRSRLIPQTICCLLEGQRPKIVKGAERYEREFIYIDDFVDYALALMQKGPWGRSVNVGGGGRSTVKGVIKELFRLKKKHYSVEVVPRAESFTEIRAQSLNCDLLGELVPHIIPRSLALGLALTLKAEAATNHA